MPEQPVKSGDADIVNPRHTASHELCGDGRFLGDRQVAGPGADDGHVSHADLRRFGSDRDTPGDLVVMRVSEPFPNGPGVGPGDARHQDPATGRDESLRNGGRLGRGFPSSKHNLWTSLPEFPVEIHRRKPQVGDGRRLKCTQHGVTVCFAGLECVQELGCFSGGHG